MTYLMDYIGPISLLVIILIYAGYTHVTKKRSSNQTKTQKPTSCPKCHSTKLQVYQPVKTTYSRKAAAIGHVLDGTRGALFAMLYEADRTHYHCRFCGTRFSKKENRFIQTNSSTQE